MQYDGLLLALSEIHPDANRCARAAEALGRDESAWKALLLKSAEHKLLEVHCRNILLLNKENRLPTPASVLALASVFCHKSLKKKNLMEGEVTAFEGCLRENGVKAVRLKGKSYSHWMYGGLPERISDDADLLVLPGDAEKAERLAFSFFQARGYAVGDTRSGEVAPRYMLREELSHFNCISMRRENEDSGGGDYFSIEIHRAMEFLSPMRLMPVYENAVQLPDGSFVTSLPDTLLTACNHIWNHFPYALHDFFLGPFILRLYMDALEAYRAALSGGGSAPSGFTPEALLSRAQECGAADVMCNALDWTARIYGAGYIDTSFYEGRYNIFPCDIRAGGETVGFWELLFYKVRKRDRIYTLLEDYRRRHGPCALFVRQSDATAGADIEDDAFWQGVPEITTDNSLCHEDGFFSRHINRTFALAAPPVSASAAFKWDGGLLYFRVTLSGDMLYDSEQPLLNTGAAHISFVFGDADGISPCRECYVQYKDSAPSVYICGEADGEIFPLTGADCVQIRGKDSRTQWLGWVPMAALGISDTPGGRFDFRLHYRGGTNDLIQDMSWAGGTAGTGFTYNDAAVGVWRGSLGFYSLTTEGACGQ